MSNDSFIYFWFVSKHYVLAPYVIVYFNNSKYKLDSEAHRQLHLQLLPWTTVNPTAFEACLTSCTTSYIGPEVSMYNVVCYQVHGRNFGWMLLLIVGASES